MISNYQCFHFKTKTITFSFFLPSGAMVIEGSLRLDSEIGQSGTVFTAEGESYIDFTTDVDFYETPFKMCMQMKRPETAFK